LLLSGASGLLVLLAGCTVGPDYQRPSAPVSAAYKEAAGWKVSQPRDAIDRGAWWSIYNDPVLDSLERQIDISNQNLKAAEAAFRQAEAIVAQARASFFPTAQINASVTRSQSSGGGRGGTTGVVTPNGTVSASGGRSAGPISNFYSTDVAASWTPDLWG